MFLSWKATSGLPIINDQLGFLGDDASFISSARLILTNSAEAAPPPRGEWTLGRGLGFIVARGNGASMSPLTAVGV